MVEWKAYFRKFPFTDDLLDIIQSRLLSVIANASGRYKKDFTPKDFAFNFLGENVKVDKDKPYNSKQELRALKRIYGNKRKPHGT